MGRRNLNMLSPPTGRTVNVQIDAHRFNHHASLIWKSTYESSDSSNTSNRLRILLLNVRFDKLLRFVGISLHNFEPILEKDLFWISRFDF